MNRKAEARRVIEMDDLTPQTARNAPPGKDATAHAPGSTIHVTGSKAHATGSTTHVTASSLTMDLLESVPRGAKIRVVGVGGAGGNAVNRMIVSGLAGVDFIAVNTDMQALKSNRSPQKVQIG